MKTVSISVVEGIATYTISVTFSGDTMPSQLNTFINDHIGGRPDERQ